MSNYLTLPVSIGEGLDKLSILEIKLDNIADKRKDNVIKEYNILHEKMKVYFLYTSIQKYYNMLKKTNLNIWNLMEILRDGIEITDNKYLEISKETIMANDVRFRIKSKINNVIKSYIKEEKGYKINRILIDISEYEVDLEIFIKPLYYFLINYDEVYVVTKNVEISKQINLEFNNQIIIVDDYPNKLNFIKIYRITNELFENDKENNLLKYLELSQDLIDKYI
jgi:hypothetical protein